MAATNIPIIATEPEEAVEAALAAFLASSCTLPVEGALTPATEGTVKGLGADSFVSVSVDQASQDLDFVGANAPHTYTARVVVRVALADDADGAVFRDECRRARSALVALSGDRCSSLGASRFACDYLALDTTSTTFEGGDSPTMAKAYSVTLKGRTTY